MWRFTTELSDWLGPTVTVCLRGFKNADESVSPTSIRLIQFTLITEFLLKKRKVDYATFEDGCRYGPGQVSWRPHILRELARWFDGSTPGVARTYRVVRWLRQGYRGNWSLLHTHTEQEKLSWNSNPSCLRMMPIVSSNDLFPECVKRNFRISTSKFPFVVPSFRLETRCPLPQVHTFSTFEGNVVFERSRTR